MHLPLSYLCPFRGCQMEGNNSSNVSDFSEDSRFSSDKLGVAMAIVASKIIVGAIGVVGNLLVVIVFMKTMRKAERKKMDAFGCE